MPSTAAESLADHFVHLKVEDIPQNHLDDAKALVRDYLGVALGGSQTGSAEAATRFVLATGGTAESTLIGHGARVPAIHAAFTNAISSHSIELDDVDILALFHFSPPVVSAALAVAEREKSSGQDFVAAVVAGCEMMARASEATNFSLRDRGYHTTPVCGVFGATIAAARLLKLDVEQTVSALGLAGAQASGLMEMYGPSMQKRFNPGPAARNGVTAALMAQAGFTGTASIFDGERGFCRTFSDRHDIGALTRDLGKTFPIHIEYKAYSCARPIHNAIDCALDIRRQLTEPLSAARSITMRRHPAWAHYHLNTRPKTYHEAQVSLPYSVAVALIEGAAFFPQYQNSKLADPEIRRLSDMVEVVADETLPRGVSCLMTLRTEGGAELSSQIDHPKGSIANPMTPEEMNRKVHLLGDPVIGEGAVSDMIRAVDRIESLSGIGEVLRTTIPTRQAA
ncbi:MmgE/PrpD family protein [Enterovirga rhinocerotis]|uniref:2-methylcitrate dehydratase PrpD n=1 Tax=Enterovirga rhinocerotis TaxID=1339210 RepID=A0A4R7C4E4_9HYPH|nr:MmgE/PrpD family protein [Enterovirga rhinocerotis]TDR92883.1 2-methylcitrate dehydratase PrpD [Enterovirga rhinocerotis]